ncbi:MAG: TGS domain-containing protein, partial [Thermodesulfovibrionales bacterium]
FYSISKKMQRQQINFDEVYDLTAFRIILESDKEIECYEVLSLVHALWKPVPGRFKDYIAMPKANNYRSLHTIVIGPYGERVEIQIRTRNMHEWAEEGIAAHWRYKEGLNAHLSNDEEQIKKLRELLEVQQELKHPREFMTNLKLALFPEEVYVFTPKGDVRSFPRGATPIDFAYSIHTDVGSQCIGAKVNRSIVPLKYELKNGDTVEVITQAGHHPSKDWLKHTVTPKARAKIRNWIKEEERERSISLGRNLLESECKKHNLKLSQIIKSEEIKKIYQEYSIDAPDSLMATVGYGKVSPKRIVQYFLPESEAEIVKTTPEKKRKRSSDSPGVSLTGIEDVMVTVAKCCHPIPGDEISGYISRGRGVVIHTAGCPNIQDIDTERIVDVAWNIKEKHAYPVHIRVVCNDQKGVLAEISAAISSLDINISHADIDTRPNMQAICNFMMSVNDLNQLKQIISTIKKLKNVIEADRINIL